MCVRVCVRACKEEKDMDIGRYVADGAYMCYGFRRKNWIGAAIGAAIGVGSTLFGAAQSAKANREARRREDAQHMRNQAYFNRKYNEDYSDTAAGQNMIREARDYADANWKKAQGASAVGGGTDASSAMAKEAGNKVVSDTIANMAANDTARKDRAGEQMVAEANNYTSQQAAQDRAQGANIAQAASGMGNAAMSLGASLDNSSTRSIATEGAKTDVNAQAGTANTRAVDAESQAPVGGIYNTDDLKNANLKYMKEAHDKIWK